MTTAANAAPATPAVTPAPAQPVPGSPEHAAAMVAAFDNQVPKTDAEVAADAAAAQAAADAAAAEAAKTAPTDPAKPEPGKEGEEVKEPKEDPATPEIFKDPDAFTRELVTDGKLSDKTREGLKALGIPDAIVAAAERGILADLATQESALHQAAGSKEAFDALVAWGQQNLTQQERDYFDAQLNSPFRAEAVALLKQRAGAAVDPALFTGNGGRPAATPAFESQAQMVQAMSDPRYQTDPAYRADVARRLAASAF